MSTAAPQLVTPSSLARSGSQFSIPELHSPAILFWLPPQGAQSVNCSIGHAQSGLGGWILCMLSSSSVSREYYVCVSTAQLTRVRMAGSQEAVHRIGVGEQMESSYHREPARH